MIKIRHLAVLIFPVLALFWYLLPEPAPVHVDISKLQVADSFSMTTGDGRHHLYIFESLDCAFCAKLHPELAKLRNTTVHIFPLPGHSASAKARSQSAWCAADPGKAWSAVYLGIEPTTARCPSTALERNLSNARSLGLSATPAIIFGDGSVIQGYQSAAQLQAKAEQV